MILSKEQLSLATQVGELRTRNGREAGRNDYLKCDRALAGSKDVQAAIAECALALKTGFPWRAFKPIGRHQGRANCEEPDVGPLEVKSISKPHHKLILHSHPLMLVPHVRLLVEVPRVAFTGWAFGFEVWKDKYWDTTLPTPAYARKDIYGLESLWNWCKQGGWNLEEVACPVFAEGWEP